MSKEFKEYWKRAKHHAAKEYNDIRWEDQTSFNQAFMMGIAARAFKKGRELSEHDLFLARTNGHMVGFMNESICDMASEVYNRARGPMEREFEKAMLEVFEEGNWAMEDDRRKD